MTFSVLGTDTTTNTPVQIFQASRREGLYILGATGSGKSTTIENLVLQDINQGLGICLLDPHGDLTNAIISRMKKRLEDVVFIDLANREYVAPFNLFHCESPSDPFEVENIVSAFMHILESVYQISPLTPQMSQYYTAIAHTLIYNPTNTLLDIPRLLTDELFRKQLVANISDPHVKWFWEVFFEDYRKGYRRGDDISAVVNKLDEFIKPVMKPWFGAIEKTLNFRELMDQRKLVFIKLNSQWGNLTKLIGNIVIAQLLDAAYSRRDIPVDKRRQMNIYVDEFQKFASEDFATLFTEARKYGLGLSIANQVRNQIEPAIKATCDQAANIVVFRVSSDNAKEVAGTFDCSPKPGPTISKPLKTPVREPIQFMVDHGVYPQETTRIFIDKYGQLLIDRARREEDIERDRRREQQRYEHDLVAGVRYIAPPLIQVTHEWRVALKTVNSLFYQAMLAGKAGENPDDIPMPSQFYDTFIQIVPNEAIYYLDLQKKYLEIPGTQHPPSQSERMILLQNRLTEFPSHIQKTDLNAQKEIHNAQTQLANAYRAYLLAEMAVVREHCIIVKTKKWYRIANIWRSGNPMHPKYNITYSFLSYAKPPFFPSFEHMIYHQENLLELSTWEDAVTYFCELFSLAWFRVENTLSDKRWWQKQKQRIHCNRSDKEIQELETWTLLPGIERTWYTDAMLEAEIKKRIEKPEDASYKQGFYEAGDFRKLFSSYAKYCCFFLKENNLSNMLEDLYKVAYDTFLAKKNAQEKSLGARDFVAVQTKKIEYELYLLTQLQKEKETYDLFIVRLEDELRQVMRELANAPVEADSGLTQEVPGSEIPSTEVESRIANQLKMLPKYTARARLESGEYTIATIKPTGYMGEQGVQKRIEEIQQRNVGQGYLRLRADVEKEINDRMNPPDPPAPPVGAKLPKNSQTPAPTTIPEPDISDVPTDPAIPVVKPPGKPNMPPPTPRRRKIKSEEE